MIISILNVENLTQELESKIYCYSNDTMLAALLSETPIENSIRFFDYGFITEFMIDENWKQPTEEVS